MPRGIKGSGVAKVTSPRPSTIDKKVAVIDKKIADLTAEKEVLLASKKAVTAKTLLDQIESMGLSREDVLTMLDAKG